MPVCRECEKKFSNREEVNGEVRNIGNRKYCLECLPFGSGRKPYITKYQKRNSKICAWCNVEKEYSEYYKYKKQKKYQHICKECQKDKTRKRIQDFKKKCIDYKGGKCEECGYSKCNAALEFHHLDPDTKDFKISGVKTRKWENIKYELDKCRMLCSNCHKEAHYLEYQEPPIQFNMTHSSIGKDIRFSSGQEEFDSPMGHHRSLTIE